MPLLKQIREKASPPDTLRYLCNVWQVKEGLVPLLKQIREKGTPPDTALLQGTFDAKVQAELCSSIAKELGFDLEKGRLDVSVHPFTGGEALPPVFVTQC